MAAHVPCLGQYAGGTAAHGFVLFADDAPVGEAAKWSPDGATCPFCKKAPEDKYHRFWACPQWDLICHWLLGFFFSFFV